MGLRDTQNITLPGNEQTWVNIDTASTDRILIFPSDVDGNLMANLTLRLCWQNDEGEWIPAFKTTSSDLNGSAWDVPAVGKMMRLEVTNNSVVKKDLYIHDSSLK